MSHSWNETALLNQTLGLYKNNVVIFKFKNDNLFIQQLVFYGKVYFSL